MLVLLSCFQNVCDFQIMTTWSCLGVGEVTSLDEICACVVSEDPSVDTPCLSQCDPLALYNSLHCKSCIQLGKKMDTSHLLH